MSAGGACRECGTAIPGDSPGGFCAHCLLQLGLESGQSEAVRGPESKVQTQEPGTLDTLTEKPGGRIGRYRLLEEIGHGGCGVVYMAEQEHPVRRKVALKVIKLGMDTRQVVARFEAERQALALMDHPNIARVLDAGATGTGRPFFVMELVGGVKITDYCAQNQLNTEQRLDLFVQVCRAIQHAHQKGIIHRDIKPSNVLVAQHDGVAVPKVIDFGIAKATQGRLTDQTLFTAFEQFIGTPAYMSPEQAQLGGLDVDTRSDIYSLGVLLYELLTGKTPFDTRQMLAGGLDEIRRTIQEKEPTTPSTRVKQDRLAARSTGNGKSQNHSPKSEIEKDLDWIVMKCMEKDRTRRYETANGLAMDIERHLNNEPVVARPPSQLYRLQKLYRRNRLLLTASAAIVLVLLLGVIGVFSQWRRAERHAELERDERQRAEQATGRALATLSQMEAIELRRAEENYEAGDRRNMLPYLALVLRQNPANRIAAERLFSTLSHRNWARLACPPLVHSNRVTSAMFSRDGRRVVTSAADNTAWVWDAGTGQRVCGPLTHQAEINAAEFSPDGQLVVTASDDRTARVWDARTGRPVTEPILHPERVELARFSPDSRSFVTLCDDRVARLWNAQSGRSVLKPLRHGDGPPVGRFFRECDFSPDGMLLATATTEGGPVVAWDCRTGEIAQRFEHSRSDTACVRFSPDGRRLAAAFYTNSAAVWDLTSHRPQAVSLSHKASVISIEFSPEGDRVVTASRDATAQVWDPVSGKPIGIPLQHADLVRCAVFSPEGLRIVTASSDQTVRVWDAQTGEPLTESMACESGVFSAQFSPDGERVLTACNGKAVLIWQVIGSPALSIHAGESAGELNFSPHGRRIAVASFGSRPRVWDALTGRPLAGPFSDPPQNQVHQVIFSPDGNLVATACDDGGSRISRASDGRLVASTSWQQVLAKHHLESEPWPDAQWVAFSPDGARVILTINLASGTNHFATICDSRNGELLLSLRHDSRLSQPACFSPDGTEVLTATQTGTARVWNAYSGKPVTPPLSHPAEVTSAQFSPDGRFVLTTARAPSFFVWDKQTGRQLEGRWLHRHPVWSACYSSDGKRVLTSSFGDGAQIWDLATGTSLVGEFGGADVVRAKFGSDGSRVLLSYHNAGIQMWDASSGQRLTELFAHGSGIASVLSKEQGGMIASSSTTGTVRIWEAPPANLPVPEWLPELAEALAGQRFDRQGLLKPVSPLGLWAVQARMAAWVQSKKQRPDSAWFRWAKSFISPPNIRPVLPSSPLPLAQYAQSLAEERVSPGACREALLLQPNNVTAMASVALTTTNNSQADWLSRRAVEQAPDQPGPVRAREDILRRTGRFEEALSFLESHRSLWERDPWIWRDQGDLLESLGRLDRALESYSRGISLARATDPAGREEERTMQSQILNSLLTHRWRLLKRLNRPAEAQKDFLEGNHIPVRAPRIPASHFSPVDLRPYLNQSLQDFHLERSMGAANATAPLRLLAGVEFELCGYILLDDKDDNPVLPSRVLNIQIGQRARALHFLQGCDPGTNQPRGYLVGSYRVHYTNGADETIPIEGIQDVRWWFDQTKELGRATEAWNERNDIGERVRLFKSSWNNPHPEQEIKAVDFLSAGTNSSHPLLFAITAEQ